MARMTLRARGQLTLPDEIRKAAGLREGDLIEAELTEDGILLCPLEIIDRAQAWFWTDDWQAKEREADEDLKAGRVSEVFSSGPDFIAALEHLAQGPRPRRRG